MEQTTVSLLAIVFMVITLLISLVLPVGAVIVLCVKKVIRILPVLIGAAVFFVFQLILRIPALQIGAQLSPEFAAFISSPILGGLFLGLTAGIFEEFGRFIGYKAALKKYTRWQDGLAFGIGHGGIEAVILVGLTYINNLIIAVMINSGMWQTIASTMPAATAQTAFDAITQTSPHMFLVGGVERLFAMTIQIALSILVLYAIRRKRFLFVLFAVLLHLVVDAPIGLIMNNLGVFVMEAYVALCAAASAVYIVLSRKVFAQLDETESAQVPAAPVNSVE